MKSGVTLQAQLTNVSTRVDGSLKLSFLTQELNAKDGAALLDMRNKLGWLLFSADELSVTDVPEEKIDSDLTRKSQSERMRSVLFVFWKQHGSKKTFDEFYRQQMDVWIDQIKERLEPKEG